MYSRVGKELIYMDFNPVINVDVYGQDLFYLVELREYKKNQETSMWIETFNISHEPDAFSKYFYCGIEFYMDFEINVYKLLDDVGIVKIFTHRYNDNGKMIRFDLHTDSLNEAKIWNDKIFEYKKIHGCKTQVLSKFDQINRLHDFYYETTGLYPYKTYRLGRFPKVSNDFKSKDPRTPGYILMGYWKKFWSYQHPRNWNELNSEQIAEDILGL